MSDALSISLPILVKALPSKDGRRIVAVEASNESVDTQSDVILQCALLESAKSFLETGIIDRDHLSEIGDRIPGLPHPPSHYVVGRPLEVNDLGGGRTGVLCELNKSDEAESIWKGLHESPPINWRASIYGCPTLEGLHDARVQKCPLAPAAGRYVVSKIRWKSLALTRNPVNQAIKGSAHIVSMKAFIEEYTESMKGPTIRSPIRNPEPKLTKDQEIENLIDKIIPKEYLQVPRNRIEMLGHCKFHCDNGKCDYINVFGKSIAGFRSHFQKCCCMEYDCADIYALAMMRLLKYEVT